LAARLGSSSTQKRRNRAANIQKSIEQRVHQRTRELRQRTKVLKDEIARRKGLEGEILEISDRETAAPRAGTARWTLPAFDRGRIHGAFCCVAIKEPSRH